MNRQQKRENERALRKKIQQAKSLQESIRLNGGATKHNFKRLKDIYTELESSGLIRKKNHWDKLKENFKSLFKR